ncbi:MAG: hypothetical protein CW716_01730 [Candidatus Bathyarchaeum sp.]|nr:MAG: hypothetical protein CW716_01730 [Candidatus Bathyarchaeum sp.]
MTEPPYWVIMFGIFLLSFVAIFLIVKARRRNESVYYWVSGSCFLLVIAFVAVLFYQILLFFALTGLVLIILVAVLPQIRELSRQELVKQKQETDVSAPLRLRDFLTFKGWIKLKATHGLRVTVTLYLLTNMAAVTAVSLVFMVLGYLTPLQIAFYVIFYILFSFIISYRQVWKTLQEP